MRASTLVFAYGDIADRAVRPIGRPGSHSPFALFSAGGLIKTPLEEDMAIDTSSITEHMDVIAADGEKIGKVDHFQDGRIKLTKNDSPDGQHHFVPLDWVDHVDAHVHLNKSLADIRVATGSPGASEAVPSPS